MTDPIARFRRWFREAERAGEVLPESMALATADRRGRPSVRIVLLKEADDRGFVFYTNRLSKKGAELDENPRASLAIHWKSTRRQVRIDGRVTEVSAEEADAYWKTRPRESQLAALASRQSARIGSRDRLVARYRELRGRFARREVPRPPHWTGYRLSADTIEFWTHREHRLHDRELFRRSRRGWTRILLQP